MKAKKFAFDLPNISENSIEEDDTINSASKRIWMTSEKIFIRVPEVIDSDFYDEVSAYLLELIISKDTSDIVLLVDSEGGEVDPTIDVYNLLQAMDNKIITVAFNKCCSVACVLFALGDERYFLRDTTYILHQIRAIFPLKQQMQTTELKEFADSFEDCQNNYKQIISTRTKIPKNKLKTIFSSLEDTFFTEKEIIKYNIATQIFSKFSEIPL